MVFAPLSSFLHLFFAVTMRSHNAPQHDRSFYRFPAGIDLVTRIVLLYGGSVYMKNSFLIFMLCLGAATAAHAERFAVPVLVSAPDKTVVHTLTGSIDTVSIANAAKGLRSEIIIAADKNSAQFVLTVKATTTIYDAAWKPTGLEALKKNDRIRVKYITTGEGFAEALSIKQLQQ